MIAVETKRVYHPQLDRTIEVPTSAVPHHQAAGWQLVEEKPATAEVAQERPPRRRRAVEEENH